ncbi:lipoprotein [Leptospira ryugenii]|uniref:Lipoprotein n=2 Tax=Leptospira ryugenii TaxID=1917863 RepID=A0A2P2DXJ7_9LEPT|nr:lipoprotein [Leptospira ryugenii]
MLQMKRFGTLALVAALSFALVACGKSRTVKISASEVERSKTPAKLPAEIEKLWKNRHNEADLRQALVSLEQFANENPQFSDVKVLLCRGNYLMGDGHLWLKLTGDADADAAVKAESIKFYDAAVGWCEAALALNPKFRDKVVKDGIEVEKALDTLGPEDIDALYWRYASLGKWSRLSGFTTLLANRSKFTAMINRVKELEKDMGKEYFYAATLRYDAASNALSPTGDKKLADKYFEEAIKRHPNYFAVRVLYAESRLKGDEAKFKSQLDYVIKGNPKSLPELEPDQIVEQRKAKKLLEDI